MGVLSPVCQNWDLGNVSIEGLITHISPRSHKQITQIKEVIKTHHTKLNCLLKETLFMKRENNKLVNTK
jgi:hypothetical protein